MSSGTDFLETISRPRVQEIEVQGRLLKPGSRVRLKPRSGGDILSMALAGRTARIDGIEEDDRGAVHIFVVVEDDPGRDLAGARHPAHRFLFSPDEVEPLEPAVEECPRRRVLVAGIGNIFFGDDGFGPAVARRLLNVELPPGMEVADFGIRGLDLAYALGQGYDAAILADTLRAGGSPGRLWIMEPDAGGEFDNASLDSHHLDPVRVIQLARRLGGIPRRMYLVGCEPGELVDGESLQMNLSPPVAAAVERAAATVLEMAGLLLAGRSPEGEGAVNE